MVVKGYIALILLAVVLVGCLGGSRVVRTNENESSNTTTPLEQNISIEEDSGGMAEVVEATPNGTENESRAVETVAMRTYTDSRGRIRLEYPESWWMKTNMVGSGDNLQVELIRREDYPGDSIKVAYSPSQLTMEAQEAQMRSRGLEVQRRNISGVDFIQYDSEFQPLPNKWLKQRMALAVVNGREYKISLVATLQTFDALEPAYAQLLESVRLLNGTTS